MNHGAQHETTSERLMTNAEDVDNPFLLDVKTRSYKHQYSNIYFTRLHQLKAIIQGVADSKWKTIPESPTLVPRLLEVVKGHVCYIIGTVYMDMPLKPNVLEDLARDRSIPAPAPREKFWSDEDGVMLEDESGRIRLVGDRLKTDVLMTGIIVGALGMENPNGDFEVVDLCFADVCPNENTQATFEMEPRAENRAVQERWIAVASGFDIGSEHYNEQRLQMLVEYLSGELTERTTSNDVSKISRLLLIGNSLVSPTMSVPLDSTLEAVDTKATLRRTAKDRSDLAKQPVEILSEHLLDIANSIPLHILPGETDPTGAILPQQALPHAMFGPVSALETFHSETNPTVIRLMSSPSPGQENTTQTTRNILATSGQTLDDMFKYVHTPPTTRLDLAEATLRWRHLAPTAPDTLWCHPYFTKDPFVLEATPDLYLIGNQPEFATRMVVSTSKDAEAVRCRAILVPSFSRTGILVLVDTHTLDVKTIEFAPSEAEHIM